MGVFCILFAFLTEFGVYGGLPGWMVHIPSCFYIQVASPAAVI